MQLLKVKIGRKDQKEPLFNNPEYDFVGESGILGISILEGGMESGKAAIGIIIELPPELGSKKSTLIQITENNFMALYNVLQGAKQNWEENPLP